MASNASFKAVLSAVDNLSPTLKRIQFASRVTYKSLADISRSTSGLMASIGKPLAVLGGAAGIGGLIAGSKGIIGVNAQFEDFQATLETLLGSAGKAKESMAWVEKMATSTPFELSELTKAFVDLRAFGVDPTQGALKSLGDVASLFNAPLAEATNAFSSAMRGNTQMLDNFGVQAKIVGDKMILRWEHLGKRFATKIAKDNPQAVAKGVQYIWNEIAGGNMEKKSRTWNGIASNISDSFAHFARMVGQAGFFDYAKQKADAFYQSLAAADSSGKLQALAGKISKFLIGVLDRLLKILEKFNPDAFLAGLDNMAIKFQNLASMVGGVDNLFIGLFALFNAGNIASVLAIGAAFVGLAVGIGKAALALGGLALANPVLAAILLAVGAVGYAGYQLWKNWDTVKAGLLKTWEDTKGAADAIWNAIKQGFTDLWNAPRLAAEAFFTWMDGKLGSLRGIAERVGGFFGGSGPAAAIPANVAALADKYAGRYEIPPELLRRLIMAESGGNPKAVSSAGAMGLMQLMPGTAKRFGVRDPFDPAQNIAGGTAYLDYLLSRYGGDQAKALAAYNAGEGNVDKYGGVPPFRETQAYVDKILGAGRQNITGDVRVRFENAPAGMRVEPQRQSGPLTITPEVGYRGFATGMP